MSEAKLNTENQVATKQEHLLHTINERKHVYVPFTQIDTFFKRPALASFDEIEEVVLAGLAGDKEAVEVFKAKYPQMPSQEESIEMFCVNNAIIYTDQNPQYYGYLFSKK